MIRLLIIGFLACLVAVLVTDNFGDPSWAKGDKLSVQGVVQVKSVCI